MISLLSILTLFLTLIWIQQFFLNYFIKADPSYLTEAQPELSPPSSLH